ncbi:hypothetical protein EVAR_38496_1 [Eumeta japonica]|uniref:Uncharacterized protein n=1 Tax=Eumeta variegata TaxID=151549 RepID=A0A4C1WEC1_EUMVA|nr:hypothetical protein EVAR_38496_1 [Eumeta japonica]
MVCPVVGLRHDFDVDDREHVTGSPDQGNVLFLIFNSNRYKVDLIDNTSYQLLHPTTNRYEIRSTASAITGTGVGRAPDDIDEVGRHRYRYASR